MLDPPDQLEPVLEGIVKTPTAIHSRLPAIVKGTNRLYPEMGHGCVAEGDPEACESDLLAAVSREGTRSTRDTVQHQ